MFTIPMDPTPYHLKTTTKSHMMQMALMDVLGFAVTVYMYNPSFGINSEVMLQVASSRMTVVDASVDMARIIKSEGRWLV